MDVLLYTSGNNHCYLFIQDFKTGFVQVMDCTAREKNNDSGLLPTEQEILDNCTSIRTISIDTVKACDYYSPLYTYDPDTSSTHHTYSCATCNVSRPEPHTFGNYVSISASSHAKICSVCGYQANVQAHTFTYTLDLVGRHAKSCATCGYSATELHTYSTEYSYTTTQHWQTCTRCGAEATRTSHTLSYKYSTTQHWQACGTCSYTARAFAHTYNAYGVCTVCGYRNTIMSFDDPELPQDVPEVPTDDFIVLCAEPKEELWESIQR